MGFRSFLFSKRSYTPIPIVLMILYFSDPIYPFWAYGLFLILIGELIRINAVSYAGGRTRTIKVGANSLCISGPYSRTRNPLYIGNIFIYSGVVLFSGGEYMLQLFFIMIIYFIFQYSMIISLEEEKLLTLFSHEYLEYKKNVPRIIPLFKHWDNKEKRDPIRLYKTIKTEKRTLQNILFIIILIISKEHIIKSVLY